MQVRHQRNQLGHRVNRLPDANTLIHALSRPRFNRHLVIGGNQVLRQRHHLPDAPVIPNQRDHPFRSPKLAQHRHVFARTLDQCPFQKEPHISHAQPALLLNVARFGRGLDPMTRPLRQLRYTRHLVKVALKQFRQLPRITRYRHMREDFEGVTDTVRAHHLNKAVRIRNELPHIIRVHRSRAERPPCGPPPLQMIHHLRAHLIQYLDLVTKRIRVAQTPKVIIVRKELEKHIRAFLTKERIRFYKQRAVKPPLPHNDRLRYLVENLIQRHHRRIAGHFIFPPTRCSSRWIVAVLAVPRRFYLGTRFLVIPAIPNHVHKRTVDYMRKPPRFIRCTRLRV